MFHLIRQHSCLVILLILSGFFMVSCSSDNQQTPSETTDKSSQKKEKENGLHIEQIRVVILDSFPVQVNLVVKGDLPDNCTAIDDIIESREDNTLTFKLVTSRETAKVCTLMIQAFEEIIPINVVGLKAGIYTVEVNNMTDTFELDVDNS